MPDVLLSLFRHRVRPAATVVPLLHHKTGFCLPLSIYRNTFLSLSTLFWSFFCLFVCYLSQMRRCFFSKPARVSCPHAFHIKPRTKVLGIGGVWTGGTNGCKSDGKSTCWLHSLTSHLLLLQSCAGEKHQGSLSVVPSIYCLCPPTPSSS